MRKKLAVLVMSVVAALAIVVPVGSANAGTANVGTSACYVTVDYWNATFSLQPTWPFVSYTLTGTVGAGVHCPLPPSPPPVVRDILNSISWT